MTYKSGTIILHSRRYVNLLDLRPEEIDILDISHALSMKCRYGGHCPKFYSVAQHSVLVSNWLVGEPLINQLAGLLHDAAEAYAPDLHGPVKRNSLFDNLRGFEDEIDDKIVEKFIVPYAANRFAVDWGSVKRADTDLLRTECVSLWGSQPADWGLENPLRYEPITPWRPHDAKLMFEDRFHFLMMGLEAEREGRMK